MYVVLVLFVVLDELVLVDVSLRVLFVVLDELVVVDVVVLLLLVDVDVLDVVLLRAVVTWSTISYSVTRASFII